MVRDLFCNITVKYIVRLKCCIISRNFNARLDLFTNCIPWTGARGCCTVNWYLTAVDRRNHSLGLLHQILSTSPISRDEMFWKMVCCRDRVVLRSGSIPAYGTPPVCTRPSLQNSVDKNDLHLSTWIGYRVFCWLRSLHGLLLAASSIWSTSLLRVARVTMSKETKVLCPSPSRVLVSDWIEVTSKRPIFLGWSYFDVSWAI